MFCPFCKSKMVLDDIDNNFHGNFDNYLSCPSCLTSCIEQVRFSKRFQLLWHHEDENSCRDWSVKF